jgi:hypothetical protein
MASLPLASLFIIPSNEYLELPYEIYEQGKLGALLFKHWVRRPRQDWRSLDGVAISEVIMGGSNIRSHSFLVPTHWRLPR